jgi:hypothetical protein
MTREHKEWDDTNLAVKAVLQGWPITDEQLKLCVDRLHEALENATTPRDVTRLVGAFARLYGQNQADRLSQQYINAVGEGVQTRILSPSEVATLMDSSIPDAEFIVEPEVVARPESQPPLAPVLLSHLGFGDGVFDPAG